MLACNSSQHVNQATSSDLEVESQAAVLLQPALAQRLSDDMSLPHQMLPSGVPSSYDWSHVPRIGYGNYPGEFSAFLSWGQAYLAAGSEPVDNVRIQIAYLTSYVLDSEDGLWYVLQSSSDVDGHYYREDFVDDENKIADLRKEELGSSVTLTADYNFHFWPKSSGRKAISESRIAGVISVVAARLVLEDPSDPDNRDQAQYLMSVGSDYWLDKQAGWQQWTTNGDVGIGRFSRISNDWQWFTMHTLSQQQLVNPLPVLPSL
ncbi:hypothetical protein SNR37_003233 [Agarivorans aestuarii]|uniref:Uncharacterized protein n=1 Tax=Agarivorans aestuarii TaxID=1563703 RepID=A0ABU7G354_9ALTE|nr:hypothetical protein [Agarivorans aestuarii]MEE1673806.1 hypothetical protein [Agarivorans aestuarii]